MTHYDQSRWNDPEFSDMFTNHADDIILNRRRLIGVLVSYYGKFHSGAKSVRTLDLGCGDGTISHELAERFGNLAPTLLDGSEEMLAKAKGHLASVEGARFVRASFEELLSGDTNLDGGYGFVFSSLAIHHLHTDEKAALYGLAFGQLERGGGFVNIDVVLPPSGRLESWYFDAWREYTKVRNAEKGIPEFDDITRLYKENADNKPDSLNAQLDMLKDAGFADVDCYYKDGIFAVFGGVKP